jgi:hypothetical protein
VYSILRRVYAFGPGKFPARRVAAHVSPVGFGEVESCLKKLRR